MQLKRSAILAILLLTACGAPAGTTSVPATTPEPTSPQVVSATATVEITLTTAITPTIEFTPTAVPITHQIGIREVNGVGEFYNVTTGEKFVLRGNNYTRLAQQVDASGAPFVYHSTFNVGSYDPDRINAALEKMHSDAYNTIRVFLNGCCAVGTLAKPSGRLSVDYLKNLSDFLQKAKANGLFVIITTDGVPDVGGYTIAWTDQFGGPNVYFLTAKGIAAETRYWRELISGLQAAGAPLDAILAYELRNELSFESDMPPLSLNSGVVETANGKSYDMSSSDAKQQMLDDGLIFWIDSARSEILKLDPTALVTVGFFWPQKPHPARLGDPRVIETRPAIWNSTADFIDLHVYPKMELTLSQFVDNFGMAGMQAKPIIMGEFGAAHSAYGSEVAAANGLRDWQIKSCQFGFDGWLLWTFDTDEQSDFYNGLTGKGTINQALMPANRPDPCK